MRKISKEMVVLILAGGRGSRLKELTNKIAKPAVYFGGKYRLIDFSLSNCSNSGFDTVGVLTQYQPLELNEHIGCGSPWNLNVKNGGVTILQSYEGPKGGRWYRGTANAIFENISFVDRYNAKYVLILSGDHVYKMDYSLLLEYHKKKQSQATVACIRVPLKDRSRFGIMNIDNEGRISEFYEKPKFPKSNLASMGVYIFNWETLKEYLTEDEKDEDSSNDFGKDIIPKMLMDKLDMYAYEFKGYWKDVGTVESLWEANLDLIKEGNKLNLYDPNWWIYARTLGYPPPYISNTGQVKSSLLGEGCVIHGKVQNSVIFSDVYVGKRSRVMDSVIMPNTIIKANVTIIRAIVMNDILIRSGNRINNRDSNIAIIDKSP